MFGVMHEANLDDGAMWPTTFAMKELTVAEVDARLSENWLMGENRTFRILARGILKVPDSADILPCQRRAWSALA